MRWKTTTYAGWGNYLNATGQMARPEKAAQLAPLVNDQPAPAIGNRRSYGDACLNSGGHAIDMTRLDRFIAFDADTGTLQAQAGVLIGDILDIFAPQGWMPAVMPGTGFVTLGGAIANDVHGKSHELTGSFGQHVESIDLIDQAGELERITATSHPDLFRATIGGLGQTGIIAAATIRLARCPGGTIAVTERRMADLDAFIDAFRGSSATYQVGWVDMSARGEAMGRGILEEGLPTDGPFAKPRKARAVPFTFPGFAINRLNVRAFNGLYLRRVPKAGRERMRPLTDFFFPLDQVANWNRVYGKRGFQQFQCVLPDETAPAALRNMLELISQSGIASPLSVLKRLGPGRAGMLSFPMQGFTLAVDIATKRQSPALLAQLNQLTADAAGRVYLAKDSSLSPGLLPDMYPELADFRKVLRRVDPAGRFETDLTRRLHIREGHT